MTATATTTDTFTRIIEQYDEPAPCEGWGHNLETRSDGHIIGQHASWRVYFACPSCQDSFWINMCDGRYQWWSQSASCFCEACGTEAPTAAHIKQVIRL